MLLRYLRINPLFTELLCKEYVKWVDVNTSTVGEWKTERNNVGGTLVMY
jgi:hypothetical protein